MFETLQYTLHSINEDNYSLIETCLEAPPYPLTKLTVNGLTTICSMILLDDNDYIEIDDEKYYIYEYYSDLNAISVSLLLSKLLEDIWIKVYTDNVNRLVFESTALLDFSITGASYNMKQVTGLYNSRFPIISNDNIIYMKSLGFFQSTPILYLVSNVGAKCYQNKDRVYYDQKIVMRIYNSFSPNLPIVCNNAEFSTIVSSNALSNVWFRLVDANFIPIKLTSPLYLSASGEGYHSSGDDSGVQEPSQG